MYKLPKAEQLVNTLHGVFWVGLAYMYGIWEKLGNVSGVIKTWSTPANSVTTQSYEKYHTFILD